MRIILVRHGEAERGHGDEHLHDFGLTPKGREQVKTLGKYLIAHRIKIDSVLCSPLPRTRETTNILTDTANLPNSSIDFELCEIGEMENNATETLDSFFRRVHNLMIHLSNSSSDETILATTHAGFIMATIRVLFNISTPGTGARLDPDFASMTEWDFKHDIWKLVAYNVLP
jgi:broad specificity phosphatase PhoE